MANFTITIRNNDTDKEFEVSKEFQEGVEVDGFVVLGVCRKDGKLTKATEAIEKISTEEIKEVLKDRELEGSYIIREAVAMAEGEMKAHKIAREFRARSSSRDLLAAIIRGPEM